MIISKYLPFLSDSPVIRRYSMHNLDLHSDKFITTNKTNYKLKPARKMELMLTSGIQTGAEVSITHVQPNDIYVYAGTDTVLNLLLNATNRPKTIRANIVEVDYGRLAQQISVGDLNGKLQAWKNSGRGHTSVEIDTTDYVQDAQLNESSNLTKLNPPIDEGLVLTEDDLSDLMQGFTASGIQADVSSEPPFFTMLRNYMSSNTATEKIPLLVGMSGIAKSAMVNSVAKEYNMRMVDLRVSFMSRLDIDGLSQIMGADTGSPFSTNAPMVEFLTCTDEYIEFSKNMVTKIEDKIASGEVSDSDLGELTNALDKFKESSKIPVLFLDEITRSDKSIRGALTTIINQRIYGVYHLKQARMVAATNCPVGYEDDPDMQDMFIGAAMDDVAVLDRFNKIPLTPDTVFPIWKDYITGEGDFHHLVIEYIERYPEKAYDETNAVEKARDYDREDNLIPPYPTFRAWTYISDYLKSLDKTATPGEKIVYSYDILKGLLGNTDAQLFTEMLRSDYIEQNQIAESVDPMEEFVSNTLDAGLPAMLMGVSGIGKTTRVRNYCKKRGYDFMLIALATMDRLDIMGPPAMVDITTHISKSSVLDKLGLSSDINELKSKAGLPQSVTVRSPKSEIKSRIIKAKETGVPLVILFDELNRCPDPTVQSAIFQAVEGHFAGIDFPPHLVKVVMAGNVGEATSEAGDVDGALTARAVQYYKPEYTQDDAKAILTYMTEHHFAKPLLDYLGDDYDKVLDLVKSVDEGSLTQNVSSTRSLHVLSDALLENTESPLMHGRILIPDDDTVQDFNMSGRFDKDILATTVNLISSGLDTWAASAEGSTYTYPGGAELSKVIPVFKQAVKALQDGRDDEQFIEQLYVIASNLMAIDSAVKEDRRQLFGYYVDEDLAMDFTEYYNHTSGRGEMSVSIDDLTNPDLILDYVRLQYPDYTSSSTNWYPLVLDVWKKYKEGLPDESYVTLITQCMSMANDDKVNVSNIKSLIAYSESLMMYLDTEKSFRTIGILLHYSKDEVFKIIAIHNAAGGDLGYTGILGRDD